MCWKKSFLKLLSISELCGCSLEVGRGQRHTSDAVPGYCALQAGLWLHCVWHSIEYQSTASTTLDWDWPWKCSAPAQSVHRGQRSSFGGTPSKTVHALLSENPCLHWQIQLREAQGSHDEVCTDGSKMNERMGAVAVINRHFHNGETTCDQLSKRLPDNSTIFAAEATAISLALNYYQLGYQARKRPPPHSQGPYPATAFAYDIPPAPLYISYLIYSSGQPPWQLSLAYYA